MTWQERLTGLHQLGLWEHAMLVGLDILQTASDTPPEEVHKRQFLRGEGVGADINQVATLRDLNEIASHYVRCLGLV